MKTRIIEATNINVGGMNYGKFMVAKFDDEEWAYRSVIDGRDLLRARGWSHQHIWVHDLQTGEAALFRHAGLASSDLNTHRVWVCPLFEPFLEWLYKQDVSDLDALPDRVDIADPSSLMQGHRAPWPRQRLDRPMPQRNQRFETEDP